MASSSNETHSDAKAMSLGQANNFLALSLYKLLAEEKENLFFSPFSLSTALAMLYCGATDKTAEEMREVLGYEHASIQDEDVVSTFRQVLETMNKNGDCYTLAYANSILSQKGLHVKEEYKSVMKDSFAALAMEVDIQKETKKVMNQINSWVKEKTNGMIPHFLETLNPATVMVILNAVYFKGTWLHEFEKKSTSPQNFYNEGKKMKAKKVDMMHQKKRFPFVKKESFSALQLPYKGENIAMLILLPHSREGLKDLEKSLNFTFIQDLKAEMREVQVEVALPKFRMEYSKSLKEYFQNLGMNRVFEGGAHLGGISNAGLYVSIILHKAVLEVNEVGSEAAAVTAIMLSRCLIKVQEFIVDHPFAFVIYDKRNDLILFMGRVNQL